MKITDNYKKHKNNNPLQKYLLNNFYKSLIEMLKQVQHDKDYVIKTILDAGCGEGFTLNKLYQEEMGEELEGIDG